MRNNRSQVLNRTLIILYFLPQPLSQLISSEADPGLLSLPSYSSGLLSFLLQDSHSIMNTINYTSDGKSFSAYSDSESLATAYVLCHRFATTVSHIFCPLCIVRALSILNIILWEANSCLLEVKPSCHFYSSYCSN